MAIKIYEVSAQFKSEKYPTLDTRISIVAAENEETAKKLALSNFFHTGRINLIRCTGSAFKNYGTERQNAFYGRMKMAKLKVGDSVLSAPGLGTIVKITEDEALVSFVWGLHTSWVDIRELLPVDSFIDVLNKFWSEED